MVAMSMSIRSSSESSVVLLHDILNPLWQNIGSIDNLLNDLQSRLEERFNNHEKEITNLKTILEKLKVDQNNQKEITKNIILRVEGIELLRNSSLGEMMGKIKKEILSLKKDTAEYGLGKYLLAQI